MKKTVKTLFIVESNDKSNIKPIRNNKSKANSLDVARNLFIDHESVEEDPGQRKELEPDGEQESDYVARDVEVLDKSEKMKVGKKKKKKK